MNKQQELEIAIVYAEDKIKCFCGNDTHIPLLQTQLEILIEGAKRAKTEEEQKVLDGKAVLIPKDEDMAKAMVLVGQSWLKSRDPDDGNA